MSNLAEVKRKYQIPEKYYTGNLVEYDMKKANISILYTNGAISENIYNQLYQMPKMDREVYIGKMLRGRKDLIEILHNGIKEYVGKLIKDNHILQSEVIRMDNDAIVIDRVNTLKYTKYDLVEFRPKITASTMVVIRNIIIFYNYDTISRNMNVEVIGLGKNTELHQRYMISFIANAIYRFQLVGIDDALQYIIDTYQSYLNLELPIGFYRSFDTFSVYNVLGYNFGVNTIENKNMINIEYNLGIIRELFGIFVSYFH